MHINFYLTQPNADKSPIRVSLTSNGAQYRMNIGITVKTSHWRKGWPTDAYASDRMRRIMGRLQCSVNDLTPPDTIRQVLGRCVKGGDADAEDGSAPSFWRYAREVWAKKERRSSKGRASSLRVIAEIMGEGDSWNGIGMAWCDTLRERMLDRGYSPNTVSLKVSMVKTIMNEGYLLGYHRNQAYRSFHKHYSKADAVYLTADECEALWSADGLTAGEMRCRDLFLLSCYTGARYSDAVRMSLGMVNADGMLDFSQVKTGDSVLIPCSSRVMEILRRNGGRAPMMSQQKLNEGIKQVCRKAGINGMVRITKMRGRKPVTLYDEKWKFVTSHCGRRTCATLLYKSGVGLEEIRYVTGHKSVGMLETYLKMTKEDKAAALKGCGYFD